MSASDFTIFWIDREREPINPPNPGYPHGVDVDLSCGAPKSCMRALPYPAPRCGFFSIKCRACGKSAIITTAGRTDDPRSVRLACADAFMG